MKIHTGTDPLLVAVSLAKAVTKRTAVSRSFCDRAKKAERESTLSRLRLTRKPALNATPKTMYPPQ